MGNHGGEKGKAAAKVFNRGEKPLGNPLGTKKGEKGATGREKGEEGQHANVAD